jgi:hypothetical protein
MQKKNKSQGKTTDNYVPVLICGDTNWKIMITEKNHKLLTSQLFVTDCTKKGLASMQYNVAH